MERDQFLKFPLRLCTFGTLDVAKFLTITMQYILPRQYGWCQKNDHSCKKVSSRVPHFLLTRSIVHRLWQFWGISPLGQNMIVFSVEFHLEGHLMTWIHWPLKMVRNPRPFSNMGTMLRPSALDHIQVKKPWKK